MPTLDRLKMQVAQDLVNNEYSTNQVGDLGNMGYNISMQGVWPTDGGYSSLPGDDKFQNRLLSLVANETGLVGNTTYQFLSRGAFIQRWMDPRRDYNKECGYPETWEITSEKWQDYFERHPVANRVVELMPSECWQLTPDIVEDEDANITTPFEKAFAEISLSLRGSNSYFRPDEDQAHPVWEMCRRVDIQAGIGQFGVLLLGVDDGLSLNQPVEGWQEPNVGKITWNEQGVRAVQEHVIANSSKLSIRNIDKYVSLGPDGQLIWNLKAVTLEEEEEDEEGNKVKTKRVGYEPVGKKDSAFKEDVQSTSTEQGNGKAKRETMPGMDVDKVNEGGDPISDRAFTNDKDPQQSDYRDPMDIHGQNDIKGPVEDDREPLVTEDNDPMAQPQGEDLEEGQTRQLLYLRVFPESLVSIVQYEQNIRSPRFGQPVMYRITLNDPLQQQTGVGLPLSTVEVHYSRVIHVADNLASSEIFGVSRMRPVLNNLIDLQKIYGACGEGYWKNAFATLVAETHPQLGGDVTMDTTALSTQMKKVRDSLDRILAATGLTFKTLAPQVVDPNSHVTNQLQAICIKLGCPLRVFMGSEQGVLAANEDSRNWYGRVQERRKNYLTPRLIVPLIDRLIQLGVLPIPQNGYSVKWDDEQKLTPQEQAQVAGALTGALATFISGQCDQFMEPVTYLVEVWGWDRDKAQAVVEATMEHLRKQQEAQAMQGTQMMDPMTGQPLEQDPESGQFLDPNTGEPLQTDEFGKPVMINPETGEPMPVQQQSPQESQGPLGAEAALMQGEQGGQPQGDGGEGFGLPQEEDPQGQMEEDPQEGAIPGAEEEEQGQMSLEDLPVDPQSGMRVYEDYLIDENDGNVYDQKGQAVGNIYEEQGDEEQGVEQSEPGGDESGFESSSGGLDRANQINGPGIGAGSQGIEDRVDKPAEGVKGEEEDEEELQLNPETGRLRDANGFEVDEETGIIYDPEGNALGTAEELEENENYQ